MSAQRIIYVVCFEQPGASGGFDWTYSAADAQAIHAEVSEWASVKSGDTALLRTAVQVPWGLDADEITNAVDSMYYEQERFMAQMWPNGYPTEEEVYA